MTTRLKVLVLDDNRDAAWAAGQLLAECGCETRTCYDGHSALKEAAAFRPDVCVLDLTMPGMNGVELAGYLQEQAGYPLRLIALTGLWDIDATHRTNNAGFARHLVKPADQWAFGEAVTGQELAAA